MRKSVKYALTGLSTVLLLFVCVLTISIMQVRHFIAEEHERFEEGKNEYFATLPDRHARAEQALQQYGPKGEPSTIVITKFKGYE